MKDHGPTVVPVRPGALVRMFADRDSDGWFARHTAFGRKIPAVGNRIFEVSSYILKKDGGYVTFERQEGTFYIRGMIYDIEFPYPHPMFEVIDEAAAAQIRSRWQAQALAQRTRRRSWRWPDWVRPMAAKFVKA